MPGENSKNFRNIIQNFQFFIIRLTTKFGNMIITFWESFRKTLEKFVEILTKQS